MVGEELSKAHETVHKIVREDGEERILNMALYLTKSDPDISNEW